ncbi:hypothetical protein PYS58_10275 [Chryseobacterium indologenes]|uniref:hypothetical protein n=1 Tax=Chryseobacterium TaxID=59732 RepID=UPI001629F972|nr:MULTISPECIES: hypothetical protein [Chryseobacterium]MDM1556696.1 hypothetical protein [Chryseobacterium indologenes]WET51513.1 hypothetical protein PYS58_10275 [Chryseobacterium indologenes]
MKKFLLTATMLVAFTALSKAQQGRVGINTSTPAATLDVVANADVTRPDALLVPRLSRAQLLAKDAAYADGNATAASAQNGALVFVNLVDGTATAKTTNVTATGFYYYDGTNGNNVWKPVGGGASSQRYEVIKGGVANVTAGTYTVGASDYVINTQSGTGGVTITFPNLTAADAGRVVLVFNNNPSSAANTILGVTGQTGNNALRGRTVTWTGTQWVSIGL